MSEWIDKLYSNEEKKRHELQQKEEVRLHNAKIIRGKAPKFWEDLVAQLSADCDELRAKFSNEPLKDCRFHGDKNGVRLSPALGARAVALSLNLDGQCIDFEDNQGQANSPIANRRRDQISFRVGNAEEILASWNENPYHKPAYLSEALIRLVCGITSY